MIIKITKEEILDIINEYFDVNNAGYDKNGSVVIDETLEKILNESPNEKLINRLKKQNKKKDFDQIYPTSPPMSPPRVSPPYVWASNSNKSTPIKRKRRPPSRRTQNIQMYKWKE